MSLGLASRQGNLLDDLDRFCKEALSDGPVCSVLRRGRDKPFSDEFLSRPRPSSGAAFCGGRRDGPPAPGRLSDREAVEGGVPSPV